MEQCKVFSGNPEDVQLEVNEWLKNNKEVKIVSRKISSCSVSADIRYLGILTHNIQIVIFYNKK
ncbi:MAG TPA: hypothetical protein PLB52_02205 [Candidatus Moranbacteria bacterium]|nr:hypothetical protein [Candidatus Moranbacteria bacterium]